METWSVTSVCVRGHENLAELGDLSKSCMTLLALAERNALRMQASSIIGRRERMKERTPPFSFSFPPRASGAVSPLLPFLLGWWKPQEMG